LEAIADEKYRLLSEKYIEFEKLFDNRPSRVEDLE